MSAGRLLASGKRRPYEELDSFAFRGWTDADGATVETGTTLTAVMDEDRAFVATYAPKRTPGTLLKML